MANASASWQLHTTKLLWLQEMGRAWAGCDAPCKAAADPGASSPAARAGAGVWQGSEQLHTGAEQAGKAKERAKFQGYGGLPGSA